MLHEKSEENVCVCYHSSLSSDLFVIITKRHCSQFFLRKHIDHQTLLRINGYDYDAHGDGEYDSKMHVPFQDSLLRNQPFQTDFRSFLSCTQ